MKKLSTLPADVLGLLDGTDLTSSIGKFKDDLGGLILSRFANEEKTPSIRMSNIGKPLRQLWYEINAEKNNIIPEKISGEAKFKFFYGHLLEAIVLYLAEVSGHKVERLQEEIEVDGVKGHIDAVIDGVLVDVKSCSSYSFNKFKSGALFQDDPFGYVAQLSGYAFALDLPAAWVAIDKVSGEICILELPPDKIKEYDVIKRIQKVRTAVDMAVEPERCYEDIPHNKSGNRKLSIGCSYCPFKQHCWRDSNEGRGLQVFHYSTGPVYLTSIIKEPKVQQKQNWYEFEPAPKET